MPPAKSYGMMGSTCLRVEWKAKTDCRPRAWRNRGRARGHWVHLLPSLPYFLRMGYLLKALGEYSFLGVISWRAQVLRWVSAIVNVSCMYTSDLPMLRWCLRLQVWWWRGSEAGGARVGPWGVTGAMGRAEIQTRGLIKRSFTWDDHWLETH